MISFFVCVRTKKHRNGRYKQSFSYIRFLLFFSLSIDNPNQKKSIAITDALLTLLLFFSDYFFVFYVCRRTKMDISWLTRFDWSRLLKSFCFSLKLPFYLFAEVVDLFSAVVNDEDDSKSRLKTLNGKSN